MRAPRRINATPRNGDYLELLSGPPDSVAMRSGCVTLHAGEAVGWHSTGAREELILVLAGAGETRATDASPVAVRAGEAVYVPPQCEHDVVNTGAVAPAILLPAAS
jgi:mannose-6-phosphate isomerase-like protein (cupin superfamily)